MYFVLKFKLLTNSRRFMLQGMGKHCGYSFLIFWATYLCLAACKPDTAALSDEESAYMTDYESPTNLWGFIDTTGRMAIDPVYDDVGLFSEFIAAVNQKGLWGYIDTSGREIVAPHYRSAFHFHEGRARVRAFDLPERYISVTGKVISSSDWEAVGDFSGGLAVVKSGSHFGYIDTSGNLVIQPIFSRAWKFDHQRAVVEDKEKQGMIDLNGKYILQAEYDQLTFFGANNLVLGRKENDAFLFDLDGKLRDRIHNAIAYETDGVLVSVRIDGAIFLYEIAGKKYLPVDDFTQIICLHDQNWTVKRDSLYFLVHNDGKALSTIGYNQLNKFVDGIAAYYRDGYWGYVDTSGIELTKPVFGLAWDYSEGFARAAFKDGLAFINKKQEIAFLLPDGTLDLHDFHDGMAPVQIKKK